MKPSRRLQQGGPVGREAGRRGKGSSMGVGGKQSQGRETRGRCAGEGASKCRKRTPSPSPLSSESSPKPSSARKSPKVAAASSPSSASKAHKGRGATTKGHSSPLSTPNKKPKMQLGSDVTPSTEGKTRWHAPYVPFEKKSVFCMTKAQAHEVYGLSDVGVDARVLGEADFTNDEWLQCFEEVPRRGSKVKCRDVRVEFWPRFYTLFTSVYQEPPGNYGMEVTKAFARGFLHEHLKGPVNWASFAEDMISAMDPSKVQAKKNRWAVFHGSYAAHNSRSRQGPKIERSEAGQEHEQGLETPLSGLQGAEKNMYSTLESLIELDGMYEAAEVRHAIALSDLSEARRKVDFHKEKMHQEEGAQLLVDNLRRQLQDGEAEIQDVEKNPDAQDASKLQALRERVHRLTLTIHTLAGVVVDSVPDGARSMALEDLELA